MKKIICIGNRFAHPDNFGIKIFEKLKQFDIDDVEIIEGGVGGLNLALHFETNDPVLIVDYAKGFEKKLLHKDELNLDFIKEYNHESAFYYLLKTLDKQNVWLYLSSDEDNFEDLSIKKHCLEIIKSIEVL